MTTSGIAISDQHPLAKYAKDLGSAAMFLSLILGGMVWFGILGHRYLS